MRGACKYLYVSIGRASAIVSCLDDEVPYVSCSVSVRYGLSREGL